jgi:hypothetical protein
MDELGAYAFGPTAENADRGVGNVGSWSLPSRSTGRGWAEEVPVLDRAP